MVLLLSVLEFLYVKHVNINEKNFLYTITLIIKVTLGKYFIDVLDLYPKLFMHPLRFLMFNSLSKIFVNFSLIVGK